MRKALSGIALNLTCSQGSSIYLYDNVLFHDNSATGKSVGSDPIIHGGGAISVYDSSSLFVMSGVFLHLNR
jgi:hypothetical protein